MLRDVLGRLSGAAAALDVAREDEIRDLVAHIHAVEAGGRHHALGPLMFGVWKTVGDG